MLRCWRHTPVRAGRSRSSRCNRHRQACSAWISSRPPSRRTPASHTGWEGNRHKMLCPRSPCRPKGCRPSSNCQYRGDSQSPPRSRCSTPAGLSSRSWTCPPGSSPWRTHKPLLRRTHDRHGSLRTPSRFACIGYPRSRHIWRRRAHSRSPLLGQLPVPRDCTTTSHAFQGSGQRRSGSNTPANPAVASSVCGPAPGRSHAARGSKSLLGGDRSQAH